jgi:PAS domain S-box-containing protein
VDPVHASVDPVADRADLEVPPDCRGRKLAARHLAVHYAVTRVLAEAPSLDEATPQILQAICASVGWDAGAIWIVDRHAQLLRCIDHWQAPSFPGTQFGWLTRQTTLPSGTGLPGRVWASGQPAWIPDIAHDINFPRAPDAIAEGLHAAFAFPIRSGNDTTGVLEFFSHQIRNPDDELLSMFAALGSQIGQFIERRRAEEERDRFFILSLDLMCIAGFDGYFKRLNPAWEHKLGYTIEELLAEPFLNFVHADDHEAVRAELQRLSTGAQTIAFEARSRCKDGSYRWMQWNASPYLSEQVVYAVGRDITEHKHAEDENKRIRLFLDSIIENIPTMLFVKDAANLHFERINRAGEKLLGYRREELIGKSDYDFFSREQADSFTQKDREVLSGKRLVQITEESIQTRDGLRFLKTYKMPILDETGDARHLLGISEDITEHRALEETRRQYAEARERYARELEGKNQALSESERRYRQLTEAALDAIVVADQQGRITLFNPAAERAFGYQAAEILGQPLTLLIPVEYRERHEKGFQRYLDTRQARLVGRTLELTGRRCDGTEFPLELSLSAIDLGGDLQFLGAIRDLTERNRMREMVAQTEKLASIGLLSAGVAHEINNPLTYVANNLAVLERDIKGAMAVLEIYERARERLAQADPQAAARALALAEEIDLPYVRSNLDQLLARTRAGVHRVNKIVHDLRGLARTAPPELEEAHIPDLVEMGLEMIRGGMRREGISVDLDYQFTGKLRCVSTQISQVLLNLLMNAVQAIEARARPAGAPGGGRIRVATRCVDQNLLIEVTDNGCGIDLKNMTRLFDPFFTTKPVGEGTGLGLSIGRGIVLAHGGCIEVDSRPGEGSTFRVFLPLRPQARDL